MELMYTDQSQLTKLRWYSAPALLLLTASAIAQIAPGGTLPPEIEAAIKAAKLTQSLIPISGEEKFSQQIIKADEISFADGARLTLTNVNAPWIVVAARRIKFARPENYSVIQRDTTVRKASSGAAGTAGAQGADDLGETGRRGNDGKPGGAGGAGGPGETRKLPTVYIIAGQLLDPKGQIPPGLLNVVLNFTGIDGGDGGAGGTGGNGGRAGNGKKGAAGLIDCKEGGGPGGNGGTAGQGGLGGPAGRGGDGASIIFVVTQPVYDVFSYARINNVGGWQGTPGVGGAAGRPGPGGRGAPSNGLCKPTGEGSPGGYASPASLGPGQTNVGGNKGSVTAAIVGSVDNLFGN
jgi:hypothetical protein